MKLRPDASALRNLLSYDPETGILRWKTRPGPKSNVRAGDEAGRIVSCSNRSGGYKSRRVTVMGREYQSHHVAWCIVTGEWPATEIDHIDKNPMNDRWSNLRLATRVQQAANRNLQSNNTSGYKGVRWSKRDKKWIAQTAFKPVASCSCE